MSAASALAAGRAMAESLLTDTCVIRRALPDVLDETTGLYSHPTQIVYTGRCLVRFESSVVSAVDAQSQPLVQQQVVLKLPIATSGALKINDIATVTASTTDTALVGMQLRIAGVHEQTYATVRRLPVEVTNA